MEELKYQEEYYYEDEEDHEDELEEDDDEDEYEYYDPKPVVVPYLEQLKEGHDGNMMIMGLTPCKRLEGVFRHVKVENYRDLWKHEKLVRFWPRNKSVKPTSYEDFKEKLNKL